jgi:hypothetical protein
MSIRTVLVNTGKKTKNAYSVQKFGPRKHTVVVAYQRNGPVRTTVVDQETEAKPWIRSILSKGATLHADLERGYDDLNWHLNDPKKFKRIDHSTHFWEGDCHTNNAENYNAQLEYMRAVYRQISHPKYRHTYDEEMAWRMTNMKLSVGDQFATLLQATGFLGRSRLSGVVWRKQNREQLAA